MNSGMKKVTRTSLSIILIIIFTITITTGCNKTTYVPVPNYNQPQYGPQTTRYTELPAVKRTWAASTDNLIKGGYYRYFPSSGAVVEASKTLTLSWSADGALHCYILTENQFNNFQSNGMIVGSRIAYRSGSSGSISAYINNTDRYYAVIYHNFALGYPIKLYSAELVEK